MQRLYHAEQEERFCGSELFRAILLFPNSVRRGAPHLTGKVKHHFKWTLSRLHRSYGATREEVLCAVQLLGKMFSRQSPDHVRRFRGAALKQLSARGASGA